MKYEQALEIAERVKAQLAPHCERLQVALGERNLK
jgi:hypothetical protein